MKPTFSAIAVAVGVIAGILCMERPAAADSELVLPQSTKALAASPNMKEAVDAYARGDYKTSLDLFRSEGNPSSGTGNPLAQLMAARMIWSGQGSSTGGHDIYKGDVTTMLYYLKLIFEKDRESGTRSLAREFAKSLVNELKDSSDRNAVKMADDVALMADMTPPSISKALRAQHTRPARRDASPPPDFSILEGWELHELWGGLIG